MSIKTWQGPQSNRPCCGSIIALLTRYHLTATTLLATPLAVYGVQLVEADAGCDTIASRYQWTHITLLAAIRRSTYGDPKLSGSSECMEEGLAACSNEIRVVCLELACSQDLLQPTLEFERCSTFSSRSAFN